MFFNSSSELATLTNTFAVNGVNTDPSSVTLNITSPTNVVTTPTPTKTTTGVYTADVTCDEAGTWSYEWVGTGAASDAAAGTWQVLDVELGRLYCPVEMLKSRLGIEHTQVDFELHAACFAASRWVETYVGRVFWRSASEARTFVPTDCYRLILPAFCDLVSVTTVKTDPGLDGSFSTTLTTSDYQLYPYNPSAAPEQRPYTELRAIGAGMFPLSWFEPPGWMLPQRRDTVQITGIWGWPKVPMAVKQATAIIAADTFTLKDAPFGVEGHGDFAQNVGDNRRAMRLLDPYRRNVVLVG